MRNCCGTIDSEFQKKNSQISTQEKASSPIVLFLNSIPHITFKGNIKYWHHTAREEGDSHFCDTMHDDIGKTGILV